MMRRKVCTTVYLDPEQYEQLRKLSRRTRVAVAVYIRDAVDAILQREEAKLVVESTPITDALEDFADGARIATRLIEGRQEVADLAPARARRRTECECGERITNHEEHKIDNIAVCQGCWELEQ